MPQYRNTPEGFITVRKRSLSRSIFFSVIAVTGGLIIFYLVNTQNTGVLFWILYITFITGLMAYTIFKVINRQKEIYDSYLLTTGEDYLSRQQTGLPVKTLFFSGIKEITEDKEGNLVVKGTKKEDVISISVFVENYEELKTLLQSLRPITPVKPKNFLQKYALLFAVVPVALLFAVYVISNKIVVGISGTALIILMVWSFYNIRTSPLVDIKIKRFSWFILIIILSVMAIMYQKIFAGQ